MQRNKQIFYDESTQELINLVLSLPIERMLRVRLLSLTVSLRKSISMQKTRECVLGPESRNAEYPAVGFARAASECIYRLVGGKEIWQPMYIDYDWEYGPHCYLIYKPTNKIYDITWDQYKIYDIEIPYDTLGKPQNVGHLLVNDYPAFLAKINGIDLIGEAKKLGTDRG